MPRILNKLIIAAFLLLAACIAYGQDCDQFCTFQGGCFFCGPGSNQDCRVTACHSCSSMECTPTLSADGKVSKNCVLPDRLYSPKLVSFHDQLKDIHGTQFLAVSEENAPAKLTAFIVETNAVLSKGTVTNAGKKTIAKYQVGWVIGADTAKKVVIRTAPEISAVIKAGGSIELTPITFTSQVFKNEEDLKRVGFFVANVTFADGTTWHTNLKQLRLNSVSPASTEPQLKSKL
jgi:hypothetical protein